MFRGYFIGTGIAPGAGEPTLKNRGKSTKNVYINETKLNKILSIFYDILDTVTYKYTITYIFTPFKNTLHSLSKQ